MRTIQKRFKILAITLISLILLQSCAAYEAPLSIKEKKIDNPRGFDKP